jgi:hypothetical protein
MSGTGSVRANQRLGCRARDRERHAENRVGAELGFVGSPIELDHRLVDEALVDGVEVDDFGADDLVHIGDGAVDTLAAVAGVLTVAQLERFVLARRCPGGNRRPAQRAGLEADVDLDGGVAPGVHDLARVNVFDDCHDCLVRAPGRTGIGCVCVRESNKL